MDEIYLSLKLSQTKKNYPKKLLGNFQLKLLGMDLNLMEKKQPVVKSIIKTN